jgi:hypothetical protein
MLTEKRLAWLIFAVLLVCYAWFPPRWADWNQNSRFDLTLALVEQGTIRIDDYYANTGDYAVYDSHYYTDKAPGTSLLGAPAYALYRIVADTPPARALLTRLSNSSALGDTLKGDGSGVQEQKVYRAIGLYVSTFFAVTLPSAALGVVLFLFLGRFLPSTAARFGLTLAYGLGTNVFPYSTVFYGHQIAAVLLFCSFVLLYRIRLNEISSQWLWAVGAMIGLAVLTEFPALFPAALLGAYALWMLPRARKWEVGKIALGGFPFALILGFYNYSAFGSPFASSYKYLGRFPEIPNTGVLGFSQPSLEAVWGVTLSPYRGLFFLSPFLLLVIPGLWILLRDKKWKAEGVLFAAITLAQLALLSAWYDWRGGFAIGPRNLLNVLPFFMPPVAACVAAWRAQPALQWLTWGAVAVSFVMVWVASVSGQDFPPIVVANPWIEFFWPKFLSGDITRNVGMVVGLRSWISLIPLGLLIGGALWIAQRTAPSTSRA